MANFDLYFPKLITHEGGYVNDAADKGGETYRGISRKNFPNWAGWQTIDQLKPIKRGTILQSLEALVKAFYKSTFWTWSQNINNQMIAEILVDWRINGGFNAKKVQQMVGEKQDGKIGSKTIAAINRTNATRLFETIKQARATHYAQIVRNDPTQKKFEKGWFDRLESFKAPAVGLGIGALIMIAWVIYLASESKSLA
jgi:lysozyme family protein